MSARAAGDGGRFEVRAVAPRMRRVTRLGALALAALAPLPFAPHDAIAQGFRGWANTSVQLVELRPFAFDESGWRALPEDRTLAATQDLSLTVWGLGVQGLSATGLLRARVRTGADILWPRSDDELDALLAYAQLQRGALRVRAGRLESRSGLGFTGFDGGSVAWGRGSVRVEVYGGRSLARGLREPANEALEGLDDFRIDKSVWLIGASASARVRSHEVGARYEREILSDRSGLHGERAALDFSTVWPRARVYGSVDYDFSFERVGTARFTASVPLAEGRWLAELTARRYVPYFDLSTIWGFFEPVSYTELVGRVGWSPSASVVARLSGGWRRYADAEAPVILRPLTDTGWRAGADVRWLPAPGWTLDGSYRMEWGPGGFLSSADASARRALGERVAASVWLTTFQQIEEFRIGDGRAFGGGASVDVTITDRVTLAAGGSILRHRDGGTELTSPWSQERAWTSLRLELGGDPALADRGARSR